MNGKTKRVLEEENSTLKDDDTNLKLKCETLFEENKILKSKCNPEKAVKSTTFNCYKWDTSFGTFNELKKHKSEHEPQYEVNKCGQYEKTFDEEWKMNAHMKSYKNYPCSQCGKTFKYLEILKKHSKITHENFKIYFHYFNNNQICQFQEECLFLHEEADTCKYGKLC
jgi:hypothetical protein